LTGQCNQKKGQQVGATDYVTKFEPEQLALAVTRHLG
jgi:hypothetical protein